MRRRLGSALNNHPPNLMAPAKRHHSFCASRYLRVMPPWEKRRRDFMIEIRRIIEKDVQKLLDRKGLIILSMVSLAILGIAFAHPEDHYADDQDGSSFFWAYGTDWYVYNQVGGAFNNAFHYTWAHPEDDTTQERIDNNCAWFFNFPGEEGNHYAWAWIVDTSMPLISKAYYQLEGYGTHSGTIGYTVDQEANEYSWEYLDYEYFYDPPPAGMIVVYRYSDVSDGNITADSGAWTGS